MRKPMLIQVSDFLFMEVFGTQHLTPATQNDHWIPNPNMTLRKSSLGQEQITGRRGNKMGTQKHQIRE